MKLLGFYRVSSVSNGEHAKAVHKYTNVAYVGSVDGGNSDWTEEQRMAGLKRHLKLLHKAGFRIVFDLEVGAGRLSIGQALKCARPYWDSVDYVTLADEQATLNYREVRAKAERKMRQLGLALKPVGAVFDPDQCLALSQDTIDALDWVGVEAYHALGNPDPRKQIIARTRKIKEKLGPTKPIIVVAQSYDRNGVFRNISAICRINSDTYELLCKDDPRVIAMIGFAYGRVGGARDYPELQAVYRGIWEAMKNA